MTKLFFTPIADNKFTNKQGDVYTTNPGTKAHEKTKYSFRNNIVLSAKLEDDITNYGTASHGDITSFDGNLADTKCKKAVIVDAKLPQEQVELMNFIKTSGNLKPEVLKMQPLKWKYLMRSAKRGKNIMMTGPAGCGKTMAAKSVAEVLDKPSFYFNLGATQDPRSTLIGNTHFNTKDGTLFSEALFVKAIQTEGAVILLDELSRAHPDAHNILMTVLDEGQRYLRLDEADGSPTIKVAPNVTFIATANIGNEYTATRVMDRALLDRFIIVEMDVLDKEGEISLLTYLYPNLDAKSIEAIGDIVGGTRIELNTETPRISTMVSTRNSVEMASLIYDGFSLEEAAEVCIYPQFDNTGGLDSERTFVKQLVQKWSYDSSTVDTNEELFNVDSSGEEVEA
jgi:nitric oxide reductase NorQ protein